MTKKKAAILAGIAGGSILTTLCIGSVLLSSYAVNGKRQTLEEAFAWQKEHYDLSWYDALEKEEYLVTGYEGYQLHILHLSSGVPSKKYVILSHGYTDNRYGSLKYANIYLQKGYDCILYDLRGHGENEPHCCTYSVLEGHDLAALIADTRNRYGQDIKLGLHGESLGAATTIRSLMYIDQVDFAVADCGFADITNVLEVGITGLHLPKWLVSCASVANRIRYGYFFSQMKPIQALEQNEIPILFMHGAEDSFIVPENSERMQKATHGYSELHLIPGAGHAQSVLTAPEEYAGYVYRFLEHIEG